MTLKTFLFSPKYYFMFILWELEVISRLNLLVFFSFSRGLIWVILKASWLSLSRNDLVDVSDSGYPVFKNAFGDYIDNSGYVGLS